MGRQAYRKNQVRLVLRLSVSQTEPRKREIQESRNLGQTNQEKSKTTLSKTLTAKDENRRKVATVCWLILNPNMRVGDEKDPDEADTVGAITLRDEHITIDKETGTIHFDFLGQRLCALGKRCEGTTIGNQKTSSTSRKQQGDYLFEGVDSKKVSRFLSEKMPGLTAKVFRTWRCTKTVKEELEKSGVKKDDPEYVKMFTRENG